MLFSYMSSESSAWDLFQEHTRRKDLRLPGCRELERRTKDARRKRLVVLCVLGPGFAPVIAIIILLLLLLLLLLIFWSALLF